MSRLSLTVLTVTFLAFLLAACNSSTNVRQQELKKDEYLKSNFPLKKDSKHTDTPVKSTFDR